jgi:hypothetical protein
MGNLQSLPYERCKPQETVLPVLILEHWLLVSVIRYCSKISVSRAVLHISVKDSAFTLIA